MFLFWSGGTFSRRYLPRGGVLGWRGIWLGRQAGGPVQVLVAQTEQGRGIAGVIDGLSPPTQTESKEEAEERQRTLRKLGYT